MMEWADVKAWHAFMETRFTVGRPLPVSCLVDGVPTTVAAGSSRCELCGNIVGWIGDVQTHCVMRHFEDYASVDWVGLYRNEGAEPSPLLSDIMAADVRLGPVQGDLVIRHAHGSTCEATDFLPIDTPLADGQTLELAPVAGRSSNGTLPFFNLSWEGGGAVAAVGWSGQWHAWLERRGDRLHLRVGQEHTSLRLDPGEQIRVPRFLLVFYRGDDYQCGNNLLRRLLIDHYVPRRDDEILQPPVSHNTWFVFNEGNDTTEENQVEVVRRLKELDLGTEVMWLDAGWFEGGWPGGAGSWTPKAENWPRGLRPLGDAAHEAGMRFCVWFEPERVAPGSRLGTEHPHYVLWGTEGPTGGHDGLLNLGDGAARAFLTNLLSRAIDDWGIDIFRNDYNIDPLAFWRAADEPEREGMTEIRYCEGLYELWGELVHHHPGLMIDNCASGGRRIDLETVSLSVPLWRSDTQCGQQARPIYDQVQTSGLARYVPLNSAGVWAYDPYSFWSVATMGVNHCPHITAEGYDVEAVRARVEELKRWRHLWLGNFWALTEVTTSAADWCAWQLHRPDLGEGVVMAFRRPEAPEAVELTLREIDDRVGYLVQDELAHVVKPVPGADLASVEARSAEAPGAWIVTYRREDAGAANG